MANKKQTRFRDAETGRYVEEDYAKQNPKTTVRETDKPKPPPPPKKKGK